MGGDGGSLPTRGDLVKEKEREEKADPHEQTRARWTTCRISAAPLGDDVATCKFGMLYNRSEAVQYMADVRAGHRSQVAAFAHLKTLKDLLPLRPHRIEGAAPDAFPRWQCPITFLEASGQHAFCANRPCGCVLSVRAVREVPAAHCVSCNVKLTGEPVPLLNSETLEKLPPLAAPASRQIILLDDPAQKTSPGAGAVQLYQSPLERMREQRDRERAERERVAEEQARKAEEERRLLATRRVGALLPPPPAAAPPSAAPSSLSGRRRDIGEALAQHTTNTLPSAKRAHTERRDTGAARPAAAHTSAAKSGHLASLFTATLKKAA